MRRFTPAFNPAAELPVVRWMLILRPTVVTATLGAAMLILPHEAIDKFPIAVVVFGTYLLTLLYWLTQRISGISRPLLATQIAFDIFIVTIIVHYTGGYDSSFVGLYFLSIMCVSLFFRRLVTLLFAFFAASLYSAYLVFFTHIFGSPFIDTAAARQSIVQAVLSGMLMIIVGFISSFFSERLVRKDSALTEARLDTADILQSMNNGLLAFDISGNVMFSNDAASHILGIGRIAVGEPHDLLLADRAPEFAAIVARELADTSPGADEEIVVPGPGGAVIPLGLTTVPIFAPDGSRRGLIVNFKDLTEKRALIEMLRQSDRMAAIGELSAAIAHEIRNPLASIVSAVELLADEIGGGDSQISQLVNVINRESGRLQRISSEFLNFARMKTPDVQPLDLPETLEEVLTLVRNDPRKTENIVILNGIDTCPAIRFDPDHFKQLLLNVLINSLEALDGRGTIEIRTEGRLKGKSGFLRLVIADDGPGFPSDAMGSVFEPFFSTKKEGTGLGLALVRKMAVGNGSRVFAKNRVSGGAEVAIDIPIHGERHGKKDSRGG